MIQKANQKDWQDVTTSSKKFKATQKKYVLYIKMNVFLEDQHLKMNLKTNEN